MTTAWSNKTASAVVSAVPGAVYAVVLTAGADTATATIYDNATEGSGTILCKLSAVANTTATWAPGLRLPVSAGIYATLTGTTPSCTVAYTP
jgi:hypothetical protein